MQVATASTGLRAVSQRPAAGIAAHGPVSEQLTFSLGAEEYGVDILCVQEIRGYTEPTRIANAPDFIKGVVNLRGTIVPVIDLRLKFGVDQPRYDGSTVTIVMSIGSRTIGTVVDAVSDVIRLPAERIQPVPEFSRAAVDASHLTGIATVGSGDDERTLILLDIAGVLSSAEFGLFNATAS